MTSRESAAPTATGADVADIYDRFAAMSALDNNLHVGYWDDPDSDGPIEDAANRFNLLVPRLEQSMKVAAGEADQVVGNTELEAVAILEPLARDVPNYLSVRINLGQCRLLQENYAEAARLQKGPRLGRRGWSP